MGEQGWRSGESARLPPVGPGFDSRSQCHMWVEFVVHSRLRVLWFSSLHKNQHFQIPSGISGRRATLWKGHCKFQFIFILFYLFYVTWLTKCFVDDTNGYWATYGRPKIILICAKDTELKETIFLQFTSYFNPLSTPILTSIFSSLFSIHFYTSN